MAERMSVIMKKHGLSGQGMIEELKRDMGVKRVQVTGKYFTVVNNDCVEELSNIAENQLFLVAVLWGLNEFPIFTKFFIQNATKKNYP